MYILICNDNFDSIMIWVVKWNYRMDKFMQIGWFDVNMVQHTSRRFKCRTLHYLTIRLRGRVLYEQIVNEAQPSWLSLIENEGE